jgi:hypothetical protein
MRASLLLLCALPLVAFTCGNRLPVVANQIDRPIHVRAMWSDGRWMDSDLHPGHRLFLSDPPHHPETVVISTPDGESQIFTRDNAPDLIGRAVTGPIVGWKATPNGVLPLTAGELK